MTALSTMTTEEIREFFEVWKKEGEAWSVDELRPGELRVELAKRNKYFYEVYDASKFTLVTAFSSMHNVREGFRFHYDE